MTILATQTWVTPADYLIERSSFGGIALVWWKMCLLSAGPDTKMREVPFGGYKVRMTIDSDFWDHRSSAWRHDQIVTNLYADSYRHMQSSGDVLPLAASVLDNRPVHPLRCSLHVLHLPASDRKRGIALVSVRAAQRLLLRSRLSWCNPAPSNVLAQH
jgi:hypothetical protein